jgi:hypothetical protein
VSEHHRQQVAGGHGQRRRLPSEALAAIVDQVEPPLHLGDPGVEPRGDP